MARLLYIEASPRKDRSHSIKVARAFLESYRETHPSDTVDSLDLWAADLPRFDGYIINAKYNILHGRDHSDEEREAWRAVEHVIEDFKAADKYVFSLPMWNFGIPYKLKHFIDVLVQPGYAFSYSPDEGYKGLITGRKAMCVYARGGAYGAGSGGESLDYQKTYMETILGFIGITGVESLVVEPTLMAGPEKLEEIEAGLMEEAGRAAAEF